MKQITDSQQVSWIQNTKNQVFQEWRTVATLCPAPRLLPVPDTGIYQYPA